MNIIAIRPFDLWLADGRTLLIQRSDIEWQLADWLNAGREQFGNQAEFDFLADHLGIAPKRLKLAATVAKAFPPALRDQTISFDHYEAVANLPTNDALSVLKDAKDRHLDDRETRVEAVKRQAEISQRTLLPDDDWEHHQLMAMTRAWNRAGSDARESFLELANEANFGVIDA